MEESSPLQSQSELAINWTRRKIIFFSFLTVSLFLNFDTGVIPAAAIKIQKEIKVDYSQLAALGTFVNFGIGLACLFASFFFRKFPAKWVLLSTIILNSLFCIYFAISHKLEILYVARILMGITQAFWIIYASIWVNSFAPENSKATWLGLLQGFSPIGIIVGYATTSLIMNSIPGIHSWRLAVYVQGIGQLIPFPIVFMLPNDEIDVLRSKYISIHEMEDGFDLTNLRQVATETKKLLKNSVYIYSVGGLTTLFFVVFGMQFWGTTYLVKYMGFPPLVAMAIFVSVTITAPLFGVIIGGIISDKMVLVNVNLLGRIPGT